MRKSKTEATIKVDDVEAFKIMTREAKESFIKSRAMKLQEIIAMKKKEAKENVILSKNFKAPEQTMLYGTFEENLYKFYQQNNPPQFEAERYKDMSNTVYLGRCDADEAWAKENFPELMFIDLFVVKYDNDDWTVGYRYGEDGDYTSGKTSINHCSAHNQAAIRAVSLNIISYEEYLEAAFWGAGVKEKFPYFVKAVLKKHDSFDGFIAEYIKES